MGKLSMIIMCKSWRPAVGQNGVKMTSPHEAQKNWTTTEMEMEDHTNL